MINTLTPMVDFVLQDADKIHQSLNRVVNYAKFLKQPLSLWMFVPVDKDGNVMEEPTEIQSLTGHKETDFNNYANAWTTYNEAKSRCLFEGFEYFEYSDSGGWCVRNSKTKIYHIDFESGTVEDFIKHRLPLSPAAINQIYK